MMALRNIFGKRKFSLMDVVVGFFAIIALAFIGIIMFVYMICHMISNRIRYGKWWG